MAKSAATKEQERYNALHDKYDAILEDRDNRIADLEAQVAALQMVIELDAETMNAVVAVVRALQAAGTGPGR